ncbi:MAG: helix-turn-helix domain-containing protein [Microbacteriaceae bacterium]|uniref:helix-turn-helix domain-containing protein n=1 Tax=Microbacterium sp. TaxID=51671 RepID=UPI003F9D008B
METEIGTRVRERLSRRQPKVSDGEFARSVGMEPTAFSRAMNGKRGFAPSELGAVAKELRVSLDWLMTGEDSFPVQVAARHSYAGNGEYAVENHEDAQSTIQTIKALYRQQAEHLQPIMRREVPTSARAARDMLDRHCGEGWQRHMAEAVEQTFGIDVIKVDLPSGDGYTLSLPAVDTIVIIVPTEATWGRQNFAIAHELAHVAAGRFTDADEELSADDERMANQFAADLLMPAPLVRNFDWDSLPEDQLARLVWHWGVTFDALRTRLSVLQRTPFRSDLKMQPTLRKYVDGGTLFNDPVSDRMQEAAERRFPARLRAAHAEFEVNRGKSLAWMLGAPLDAEARQEPSGGTATLESFGLAAA